jgi:hypothetical protein
MTLPNHGQNRNDRIEIAERGNSRHIQGLEQLVGTNNVVSGVVVVIRPELLG